jgi:hypothetical protein
MIFIPAEGQNLVEAGGTVVDLSPSGCRVTLQSSGTVEAVLVSGLRVVLTMTLPGGGETEAIDTEVRNFNRRNQILSLGLRFMADENFKDKLGRLLALQLI